MVEGTDNNIKNTICRRMKTSLSPQIKINSKDQRPESLTLLEEKVRGILQDRDTGKDFMNRTPGTQEIVPKIDRWGLMELKSLA